MRNRDDSRPIIWYRSSWTIAQKVILYHLDSWDALGILKTVHSISKRNGNDEGSGRIAASTPTSWLRLFLSGPASSLSHHRHHHHVLLLLLLLLPVFLLLLLAHSVTGIVRRWPSPGIARPNITNANAPHIITNINIGRANISPTCHFRYPIYPSICTVFNRRLSLSSIQFLRLLQ